MTENNKTDEKSGVAGFMQRAKQQAREKNKRDHCDGKRPIQSL